MLQFCTVAHDIHWSSTTSATNSKKCVKGSTKYYTGTYLFCFQGTVCSVCVCVCVRKRERERVRERDTD